MEKGKTFIYFWFIKNISDNRLEYYYNEFVKSNNIKTNISSYMNSKKFNYFKLTPVFKKLLNNEPITEDDINIIVNNNQIENTIKFLEILAEVNPKYNHLNQDKINILHNILYDRTLTVESIVDKVSNPLSDKELLEEVLENGVPSNIIAFYQKKDKKSSEPENLSYEESFKIHKMLLMKAIRLYVSFYIQKRFDLLNGRFSREQHKEIFEKIKKLKIKDIDKMADHLARKKPILDDEFLRMISNTLNIGHEHAGGYTCSLFRSRTSYGDLMHQGKVKDEDKNYYQASKYDIRIYINGVPEADSKYHRLFLNEYILLCIENGIGYDLKGDQGQKDGIVLYSAIEDLPKRIQILERIKREHPEYVSDFGSPLSLGSTYGSGYYSICHRGPSKKNHTNASTYTIYCDQLIEGAILYTIAPIILTKIKDPVLIGNIKYCLSNPINGLTYGIIFQINSYRTNIEEELNKSGTSINQIIKEEMSNPTKREQLVTNFGKVIRYLDNTLQERKANAPICCDKDTANYIVEERKRKNYSDAFTLEENTQHTK